MPNIVTISVHSTFFYLIEADGGWLLVDCGWPWAEFNAGLKQVKVPSSAIRYVMFTHAHMDHAGLVQTVKQASGARLLIHPAQIPFLKELENYFARKGDKSFQPIQVGPNDIILEGDTRAALKRIGVAGEIVLTPGHSDDSISLALDSGDVFTGDLTLPFAVDDSNAEMVYASWRRILALNAQTIHPAHGRSAFPASQIEISLP